MGWPFPVPSQCPLVLEAHAFGSGLAGPVRRATLPNETPYAQSALLGCIQRVLRQKADHVGCYVRPLELGEYNDVPDLHT